ncbi:MAG: ribonuclease R [Blautia sp.]|nr:ribonuclease R [Lachnoclostridium sp.]MCM1210461.1 ribonuclease R [Blautia sp.]
MGQELFEQRKKLICELLEDEMYVPMKEKELAAFMQVARADREAFRKVLDTLLAEGKIQITAKGKYKKADAHLLTGVFIGNAKGFGFVEVEGMEEDLYIPENMVNHAFHLDKVQVELLPGRRGRRQEAAVRKVLEHGAYQIVGTYQQSANFGFVIPDISKISTDIFIPKERSKGAVDGHKVVVELTDYGDEKHKPEGKIVEILGHVNDPGVDILSIIKGFDLPEAFGEKVLNQAERIPDKIQEADMAGRKDLRDVQMVTIDGEDAKDLDDAVSLSKEGAFYHLGVHIADVSNYVQENSALDWEAYERGTSVYLVDRVIPMLPHRLSNGICSLNQGEDRLALSCLMTIDEKGNVTDYEIAETVICVDRRMSYTSVKKILEYQDEQECREYEVLVPMFQQMEELAAILRKKRHKRGSIDFDFPESKILLDEEGHPTEIRPYERNVATKMIEDFMLLANETVAQHFFWMELPFLYRTHEKPEPEKIMKLSTFLRNFGYHIKVSGEDIHPKEIQKLLDKIEGTDEEMLLSRLALRSMKRAKYTVECSGHFGLACQYYCHFTSPIRRYPDLQIHRIIKEQLRGRMKENRIGHYQDRLPAVAKHSSEMERRAEEAERETDKLKKAEYMEAHIGEVFTGVISGITSWGIYVELPNTVEGMIHVSKLPGDYYYYDENAYEMVGQDTGRRFRLGEQMRVCVDSVEMQSKTIHFSIPEEL